MVIDIGNSERLKRPRIFGFNEIMYLFRTIFYLRHYHIYIYVYEMKMLLTDDIDYILYIIGYNMV